MVLNGGQHKSLTARDGSFAFRDVTPGVYLLEVLSPDFHYSSMKIKVDDTTGIIAIEYRVRYNNPVLHIVSNYFGDKRFAQRNVWLSCSSRVTGHILFSVVRRPSPRCARGHRGLIEDYSSARSARRWLIEACVAHIFSFGMLEALFLSIVPLPADAD